MVRFHPGERSRRSWRLWGRKHKAQSTPDCAPSGAHEAPKHPTTPPPAAQHAADVAAHAAHVALTNGATIEQAQDAYAAAYLAEVYPRGSTMHTHARRPATVTLELLIVVLLALGTWLAYTGLTATTTVPTYNHQPGVVVPEQQHPTIPSTPAPTTKEKSRYV